ncbi:MAG: hypothetical protein HUU27_04900, partial [Phycisphaerae bacterium]|nr:hypothetical protein [Phycisphaerae bacterium]
AILTGGQVISEEVGLSLEGVQPAEDVLVDGLRWRADPAFVWSVPLRARR